MRVLVIEDEEALAQAIARGLRREGMAVELAFDGAAGLKQALLGPYDVIVLDCDLPRPQGDAVCRRLADSALKSPILLLSASLDLHGKVNGLNLGADHYLGKPFAFAELVARLHALAHGT